MFGFIENFFKKREGIKLYKEVLLQSVEDGEISEDEKSNLQQIITKYSLKDIDLREHQKAAFEYFFEKSISDQRVSDFEKEKMETLARYFGTPLSQLGFDQGKFNKYYCLEQIDNGQLPIMHGNPLDIILKRHEVIHFICAAVTMKRKRVTNKINYGGVTGSIKIMKGVRYRVGSINVQRISSEVVEKEDAGYMCITNQRIIFKGSRKNFTLLYDKILHLALEEGMLQITKDGKEVPYLVFLSDYEVPLSVISFILNSDSESATA